MSKAEIISHYENSWGKDWSLIDFPKSPASPLPSDFGILEFLPRPGREMWTYATCGMSFGRPENMLELHMFCNSRNPDAGEILAACAHYHLTAQQLGVGHSVNFGKPWAEGSSCDFGVVSLPYLDGPNLEVLVNGRGDEILFLWLIPVTRSEVEFKKEHGFKALEDLFEEKNFNYANPLRAAVC